MRKVRDGNDQSGGNVHEVYETFIGVEQHDGVRVE